MKKGFTFIEVALVLAVAGLIFAMVFIALPALQRSSRDTVRSDDVADFIANVKKYQTNNRGALPGGGDSGRETTVTGYNDTGSTDDTTWQGFYNKYLGNNFYDPSGENYKLRVIDCDGDSVGKLCEDASMDSDELGTLLVVKQAKCNNTDVVMSSNPRNLAVLYKLEGSGGISCSNT